MITSCIEEDKIKSIYSKLDGTIFYSSVDKMVFIIEDMSPLENIYKVSEEACKSRAYLVNKVSVNEGLVKNQDTSYYGYLKRIFFVEVFEIPTIEGVEIEVVDVSVL
ncbi:hypothetical protein ACFLY7_02560 [Patescibacteria group bacterium]